MPITMSTNGLNDRFRRKWCLINPIPEQDPITSKSYAAHYLIATVILIATLFWALWDEAWGQRPWKAFQEQFKDRYSAFLNTARSKSATSQKDVEQNPDYADAESRTIRRRIEDSKSQGEEARKKLDDASARLLAVQSVFTDRRAYVNALTYELETSTAHSPRPASKQKSTNTKQNRPPSNFPTAAERNSTSSNWKRLTTEFATSEPS